MVIAAQDRAATQPSFDTAISVPDGRNRNAKKPKQSGTAQQASSTDAWYRRLHRMLQNVTNIFLDLAAGTNFSTAFQNHMGISLTDYEEQFFGLMNQYLP